MNKLFAYSITAMISLFSFPELAHADRDDHHRHRSYEREYRHHGHYRHHRHHNHNHASVVVRQSYPAYYAAPSYYAVPSYQYVPVPEPVVSAPQPIYSTDNSDDYCREFTRNIQIDGYKQRAYGTACREPDGSWKIQNN